MKKKRKKKTLGLSNCKACIFFPALKFERAPNSLRTFEIFFFQFCKQTIPLFAEQFIEYSHYSPNPRVKL